MSNESTPAKTRAMRLYQQKCRGGKRSPVTEVEDLKICLAWEAGELSEGQATTAMGYDRVACRGILQDAIMEGRELYTALRPIRRKGADKLSDVVTQPIAALSTQPTHEGTK